MPVPTTPIKVKISGSLSTLRRMIISGRDNPMTDIINARAVPSAAPFPMSAETMGTMPAALL